MRLCAAYCSLWLTWLALGNADESKIVCVYRSWAVDNIGHGRLDPSEIDPNLCTHLIYTFVGITEDGNVKVNFPQYDLPDNGGKAGFQKFNALRKRNPRLKTLVTSVGNHATYSKVLADASLRSKYVKNVVDFVLLHEFNGFDIFWRYSNRDGCSADDVQNFDLLLKELRSSFDQHKLILSAQVEGLKAEAEPYYDIPQISKYLDLILLDMNLHNISDPITGHSTPLYPAARETSNLDRSRNINAAVHYWLSQGAPAEKLILGIRFYGMGYILKNSAEYLPGSPASGPATDVDLATGYISYSQICRLMSQGTWTTGWDEEQHVPYVHRENQWISYDNARSLTEKGEYVQAMGLGGVMAWSLDLDEPHGDCGGIRYPLLTVVNHKLRGNRSVAKLEASPSTEAKIVCYHASWAIDEVGYERFDPSDVDPNLCTHLVYMTMDISADGSVIVSRPQYDLPDNGGKAGFQKINALRKRNTGLKTLITNDGKAQSSVAFSKIAADASLRSKFANNLVDFLLLHEFDGFDISWWYPNRNGRSPDDVQNFVLLLKELRASFDHHGLVLIARVEGREMEAQLYYDIPEISKYLDSIVLNMNAHNNWDRTTGHHTPLYPATRETSKFDRSRNVNAMVHYWLGQGAPAEKLILGTRFYGNGYTLNNSAEHLPGSPAIGPVTGFGASDVIGYSEICRLISQGNWTTAWDEEQRVPYIYKGNKWITYDDVRSFTEKAEYVQSMGLGGVMTWSINLDEPQGECGGMRYPLLNTLNLKLRGITSVSTPEDSPSVGAKIVCYYFKAAINTVGYTRLDPSGIDPSLCTHLVYMFVRITENGDVGLDSSFDLPDNGGKAGFQKFNALRKRNKKLKTLVASGDSDEEYAVYSKVLADSSLRSKYVKNVVDFVLQHEFNGFDIHWQFSRNREGFSSDMQNYVLLLKELRSSFDEHNLILSITIENVEVFTRSNYNISLISSYVHFISLNIEYHDLSDSTTGHWKPLYPAARETSSLERSRNINATVHYWLNHGAPVEKLILGTQFGGIKYILNNSADHAPGLPVIDSNRNDITAGHAYNMEFNVICILTALDTWTTAWDEEQRVPYSYNGSWWISYDDARSLTEKVKYAKSMGLGGVGARAVDTDDHWGECGERNLLLKALNRALRDSDSCTSLACDTSPSTEAKIFCYYAGQTITAVDYRKLEPSAIDPNLCTHLIYASVGITEEGEVRVLDPWVDLPENGGQAAFRKLNALRKRKEGLETLVSTAGGVRDARKYSKVAADASLRSKYVKNVVDFVLRHEFDGFNIFWQYPNDRKNSPKDVRNFVLLLKELRASFDEHELILSIEVDGSEQYAKHGYDIPQISKYVDFVLLGPVYQRHMGKVLSHSQPLYHAANGTSAFTLTQNIDASVRFWLKRGTPAEKLILGTLFHGEVHGMNNSADNSPGSPAIRTNDPDRYLVYSQICRYTTEEGWTTVWDEEQHVPYSYGDDLWISYDNAKSLTEKGEYAQAMGLGGVMASSIDEDDHRGDCGPRFPLLTALNRGLRESGSSSTPVIPTPAEIKDRMKSGSGLSSVEAKIVCYYVSYTIAEAGDYRMDVSEINPNLCTHLMYGWVEVTDDGQIRVRNPQYDLPDNRGRAGFQKFNALREKNKELKTLVTCGSEDGAYETYLKIASDVSLRSKFVKNAVDFLLLHGFDGLGINWRNPGQSKVPSPDGIQNLVLLLKELRASFDEHKLILAVEVEGSEVPGRGYYDIPQMLEYVDFFFLDPTFHQPSDSNTGHIGPLFPAAREVSAHDRNRNMHSTIHYWLSQGVPAEKLILGLFVFGMIHTLNNPAEHEPGSAVSEYAASGLGRGYLQYDIMCKLISQDGWTTVWDEEQYVPYSYAGNRWVSHENDRSLTEKGKYVQAMGLGGVVVTSMEVEDRRGDCGEPFPVLSALNRVLRSASDVLKSLTADMIADEEARRTCSKLNIKYVRHPENCAKFWICQKSQDNKFSAEPFSCGKGLYFDTSNIVCKSKNSVDCS